MPTRIIYKNQESADCLPCTLRPILLPGLFNGMSTIHLNCSHNKKKPNKHSFRSPFGASGWAICVSVINIAIITSFFTIYIQTEIFLEENAILKLEKVPQAVFSFGVVISAMNHMLKLKHKLLELNGLDLLIKRKCYYGVEIILSSNTIKWLTAKVYLSYFIMFGYSLMVTIDVMSQSQSSSIIFTLFEAYSVWLMSFTQALIVFQYIFSICLYKILCLKCFKQIKKVLDAKLELLNNSSTDQLEFVKAKRFHLETKLKKLNRLYLSIFKQFKQMSYCMNPAFLMWFCIIVLILIVSYFLLPIYRFELHHSNHILGLRCYSVLAITLVYIYYVDQLNNIKTEIVPYLLQYPTLKLTRGEAAQVEAIIRTVELKRISLKASDVLSINNSLLAKIFGTITTYVLVALQFYFRKN